MQYMSPTHRALLTTLLFTCAGVFSFFVQHVWEEPLGILLVVLYGLLVIHTFFSVRFFSALFKLDATQQVIDAILVALYLFLAFSMRDAVIFFLIGFGLFSIATLKYVLLLPHGLHRDALWRKIWIDLAGAAAWGAGAGGVWLGYGEESTFVLVVSFGIANIYLLIMRPVYRL